MAHLEIQKQIAAPPQAVWDVIADLEHQKAWMVDVRELDIVSPQKQGEGTLLHVTSELFRLPVVKDVMLITAWEPPHRMDVEHRGQFHGTGQFLLAPVDGGTLFTWTEDFRPPLGALGEAAFSLAVRPHLLRVFSRSMENVRRLAEERDSR
ncbi:MAG: SRPBCC family protein [Chloroflexota bacterium]|nr:SRPBCC family protein [Chloroflexota bacterium]